MAQSSSDVNRWSGILSCGVSLPPDSPRLCRIEKSGLTGPGTPFTAGEPTDVLAGPNLRLPSRSHLQELRGQTRRSRLRCPLPALQGADRQAWLCALAGHLNVSSVGWETARSDPLPYASPIGTFDLALQRITAAGECRCRSAPRSPLGCSRSSAKA